MFFKSDEESKDALMTANMMFLAKVIEARTDAVNSMAALTCDGKENTTAFKAAHNLEADMQRMLHGRFEV